MQIPCVPVVPETSLEKRPQRWMQRGILDGSDCFHTAIEIARHPVGRAKVILLVAAVCEIKRARMLEKSSHNADHANAVAHSAHARAQTADSTNYQIDLNAGLRRLVQGLDHIRIHSVSYT